MESQNDSLLAKLDSIKLLSDRLRGVDTTKVKKTINKPKKINDSEGFKKPKTPKSKNKNKKPDTKENKSIKDIVIAKKTKTERKAKKSLNPNEPSIRKWNDFKNREDLKKGSFTNEEHHKVLEAICEYIYQNNLTQDDLIDLVTEKQTKDGSVWPKIAECLPNRSVQSIHNYCHRVLNPFNYKGAWTHDEEKKLIE